MGRFIAQYLKPHSLSARIRLLVAICLLPTWLLAGIVLYLTYRTPSAEQEPTRPLRSMSSHPAENLHLLAQRDLSIIRGEPLPRLVEAAYPAPAAERTPTRTSLRWTLAYGFASLLLLIVAQLFSRAANRLIGQPLLALIAPAQSLASGQPSAPPPSSLSEAAQLAEALEQARQVLRQKEEEHTRTLAALAASERRFRLAISGLGTIAFTLDSELRISWIYAYCNQYDERRLLGRPLHEIFWEETAQTLTDLCRQALDSGTRVRQDVVVRRLDTPEPRHYDLILEPVEEGPTSVISALAIDVTQRKRQELAQQENHQFHLAVLNSLTEHIAVLDEHGVIVAVNAAWQKFAEDNGAPQLAQHSIGLNYRCLYVSAVGHFRKGQDMQIWSAIDEVLTGRRTHFTLEYPFRAPGEFRTYRMNVYALPAPHRGAVVSHENITARKYMELALQRSEEELKRAQTMSHLGSWRYDLVRHELTWSDEVYRVLGLKPQEVRATFDGFLERIHPEDRPLVKASYPESLRKSRDGYELEHRIVRKDTGEVRIVYEKCEHVRDANGRFIYSIGMIQDITERKATEMALKAAQAVAEQANNAKSRFLAAASHDLRQPLSALALYVGSLDGRLSGEDGPLLKNMRDCVDSLNEMLTDLLDLSKLDAGVVTPQIRDFSVDDMLAKIVSTNAPKALLKKLALRCTSSSLHGRTDPVLFRRIVGNLVGNAIRYTERGGVLIGCRRHQGRTWVEVWDTGIGIPKDKTHEIFEEFKQLGNDERSRRKGSGLGLAIVARMASLLGLEIRVHSRLGKGSMFAVELPLGEGTEIQMPKEYQYRPLRIALVENDSRVRDAMVYALENNGHEVVSAATRRALMQKLNGLAPDIVISDYRLAGGRTGFDVVTSVRGTFGPHVPALIVTGDTDPKLIRRMASKGVRVQYKPVSMEVLQSCIEELTAEEDADAVWPMRQGFFWNF